MKKFFISLFFVLLLSCNDGFESKIAADSQKKVWCQIGDKCQKISESLCEEIGVTPCNAIIPGESSSSSAEESSSSSSRSVSSSSSGGAVSSSSGGAVSSSSGGASSSSGGAVSSSSSGAVSSSSGGAVSSSSISNSSSSIGISSSSNNLGIAKLSTCSDSFPYYVTRGVANQEDLTNLVSLEGNHTGCTVTYTLTSGSSYASISNDTFINFTASASSTERSLTVQATLQCEEGVPVITPLTRSCQIKVSIADKFAEITTCDNPRVSIGPGRTTVEISNCLKSNIGCDCPGKDTQNQTDWNESNNMFTLNGDKGKGGGCWATAPIPVELVDKPVKRVLIDYNKEIGCVVHTP